jgi:hypothetical protein
MLIPLIRRHENALALKLAYNFFKTTTAKAFCKQRFALNTEGERRVRVAVCVRPGAGAGALPATLTSF